jgi:hypothetical protein
MNPQNNTFQNGEDLVEIWDNAHYDEEFERNKKPLNALSRFRIRQRSVHKLRKLSYDA